MYYIYPITEKHTINGEGNGMRFGLSSMQDWRPEMEDRHITNIGLSPLDNLSFFAIFDGHGGNSISDHCADKLLHGLMQNYKFQQSALKMNENASDDQVDNMKKGIIETFLVLDKEMRMLPKIKLEEEWSGSTATCALISKTHLFLINLGDFRTVFTSNGEIHFASKDHKPDNIEEKVRIEKAGGEVNESERINNWLNVSRCFGDYEFKNAEGIDQCNQMISPVPDIAGIKLDSEKEFLILACDGIWDVMSNEEVCDFIRSQLAIQTNLSTICSSLLDVCLQKRSTDNMSVILIQFDGSHFLDEESQKRDDALKKWIVNKIKLIFERKDVALNEIIEKKGQENLKKRWDYLSISDLIVILSNFDFEGLASAGGIGWKRSFIKETIENIEKKSGKVFPYFDETAVSFKEEINI